MINYKNNYCFIIITSCNCIIFASSNDEIGIKKIESLLEAGIGNSVE